MSLGHEPCIPVCRVVLHLVSCQDFLLLELPITGALTVLACLRPSVSLVGMGNSLSPSLQMSLILLVDCMLLIHWPIRYS
jgi:hypothetical protein